MDDLFAMDDVELRAEVTRLRGIIARNKVRFREVCERVEVLRTEAEGLKAALVTSAQQTKEALGMANEAVATTSLGEQLLREWGLR